MARRRLDPCSRNARKGEKIFSSIIGTGLKMATSSSRKSSNSGCLITIIFIISLVLCFSCTSNNEETIAKENIKEYHNKNLQEGSSLEVEKFSDLYIIAPKDEKNMPKPNYNGENAVSDGVNELKLRSAGLYLALGGCCPETLKQIIINDKKFKEWKTGGKEFVMICFFSGKDKYLNEVKGGLCLRLDSTLNIYETYKLKEEQTIYDMINEK